MKKEQLLVTGAFLLAILGIAMIYLGIKAQILPPAITGIGFIVIAIVFAGIKNK